MQWLALGLVLFFASPLFAQRVGSPEAYRALAGASQRAVDNQIAWQQSKKLGYVLPPLGPHEQSECMTPNLLATGQVGLLDNWQFEVLQVVDDHNLILTHPRAGLLWLKGYPTKDCVDGEKIRLIGYLMADEPKTYTTTLGAGKTVRTVRFLTNEEAAVIGKRKAEDLAAKEMAAAAAEEAKLYRTWTDDTGKYHFDAKLIDLKSGMLQLQAKDGSVREVRVSRVSNEDREWVRDEMKTRRAQRKSPTKTE